MASQSAHLADRKGTGPVATAALRLGFLALILLVWALAARHAPPGLFASPVAVAKAGIGLASSGKLCTRSSSPC